MQWILDSCQQWNRGKGMPSSYINRVISLSDIIEANKNASCNDAITGNAKPISID